MGEKMIKVARHRTSNYYVNYHTMNGGVKTYMFSGSKGNKVDTKPLPMEVIDYLMVNSLCFKNGDLHIVEDSKEAKEVVESLPEKEEYEANTHTREEAENILKGNFNKMKATLKKVTNKDEMKFFIDVAKEIELDSNAKLKFLSEWYGVKQDILFGD